MTSGLFEPLGLDEDLLDLVKLTPAEGVILAALRAALPDLPCVATIEANPSIPFVLVRRLAGVGAWQGDPRGFYDVAKIAVHVYAADPDGDVKAAVISEAIRSALFLAWRNHFTCPFGTVTRLRMDSEPSRRSDWATSSGPVQYADLPTGGWRYEAQYTATIRPPR